MITILETPLTKAKAKKIKPHYSFVYQYLIGETSGFKSTKVKVALDDPTLERYFKILDSLRPTSDMWYVMLEEENLVKHIELGQITEDDAEFLRQTMYNPKSIYSKGIITYVERYSPFNSGDASLQYVEIFYFDEDGIKYETKVS
jgi:hypothetical protein